MSLIIIANMFLSWHTLSLTIHPCSKLNQGASKLINELDRMTKFKMFSQQNCYTI
jgi:hypothetical protein